MALPRKDCMGSAREPERRHAPIFWRVDAKTPKGEIKIEHPKQDGQDETADNHGRLHDEAFGLGLGARRLGCALEVFAEFRGKIGKGRAHGRQYCRNGVDPFGHHSRPAIRAIIESRMNGCSSQKTTKRKTTMIKLTETDGQPGNRLFAADPVSTGKSPTRPL